MLLNHERKPVWQWLAPDETLLPDPSCCPDCGGDLVAARGDIQVWHWKHRAGARSVDCEMTGGESFWHLDMKQRHLDLGFEVEYRVELDIGSNYRFDAFGPKDKYAIREFVHSLSDSYVVKARDLHKFNFAPRTAWIFDGEAFVSERWKSIKNGGVSGLVKPRAWDVIAEIASLGQVVILDWLGGYKLWPKGPNIWYPLTDQSFRAVLRPRV